MKLSHKQARSIDAMSKLDDDMTLDSAVPKDSKYLSKDDVGEVGVNLTIAGMTRDEVEGDNNKHETKAVLHFKEKYKPLIVNQTNKNRLKDITGANTVGDLRGKQVNVFNDKYVEFGGRQTGGIRIRDVQTVVEPAAARGPEGSKPDPDDDIPF